METIANSAHDAIRKKRAMLIAPLTRQEVADIIGTHYNTIGKICKELGASPYERLSQTTLDHIANKWWPQIG